MVHGFPSRGTGCLVLSLIFENVDVQCLHLLIHGRLQNWDILSFLCYIIVEYFYVDSLPFISYFVTQITKLNFLKFL